MQRAFLVLACGVVFFGGLQRSRAAVGTLTGSGSTLIAPLIGAWANDYGTRSGVSINYSAVGSSAGIVAVTQRSVDFGASDAPLSPSQFAAAGGVVQIPWALTATVLAYQIPGIAGGLRLDSSAISGIFLGTIKYWDDASIAALNPKLTLPHLAIQPVHRSDGSGDTFAFTSYLAKTNAQWRTTVGAGPLVSFPVGQGAAGNGGMIGAIQAVPGSIGYLAASYALTNHLPVVAILNQAGRYATPGVRAIAAAAFTVTRVPANNAISIVNPPASAPPIAYPIATFTYIIVPTQSANAAALRSFVFYALTSGQALGQKLGFAPIPRVVLVADEKTLAQIRS